MPLVGGRFGGAIQPITDRRTFARLHADAHVVRAGPLFIRVLDDGAAPPRLGFALGKRFGTAVSRNRARRRLRHAFIDVATQHPNLTGTFLIGAGRKVAGAPYEQLHEWLSEVANPAAEERSRDRVG